MKSYTDIEQSKVLAEILPLESADFMWEYEPNKETYWDKPTMIPIDSYIFVNDIPCWSLAVLLNILHSKAKNILSLSGGGYKDGKYISDWCLDYEFEDGDYQKTFADNPVDACVAMIEKLNELNLL